MIILAALLFIIGAGVTLWGLLQLIEDIADRVFDGATFLCIPIILLGLITVLGAFQVPV